MKNYNINSLDSNMDKELSYNNDNNETTPIIHKLANGILEALQQDIVIDDEEYLYK
jgi:hypothetical protein